MSDTGSNSSRELLDELAEEFVERHRRGERPSIDEYAQKHPELAGPIREMFPALMAMEKLKPGSSDATGALAATDRVPPKQLGDYRILREVGRGGMGVVYEAQQESLGRHVALKVLRSDFLAGSKQLARFQREARAAARLHHTNIVPVFGVGQEAGTHYYVMQLIQGQPLDDVVAELRWLRQANDPSAGRQSDRSVPETTEPDHLSLSREMAWGLMSGQFDRRGLARSADTPVSPAAQSTEISAASLPEENYWRSVARLGLQVAGALEYAHRQGVLHRDIKPSNILLDAYGTAWVSDFGLAKLAEQDGLTQTGDVVGTLRYMAPEALQGKADARTDIRGLGLTLYELITLRPAFDDADRSQLIRHITEGEIVPPGKITPQVPRDLETIVMKAVERDPAHRYQSGEELAADLERFLNNEPIRARRVSVAERFGRWCRRNPRVAGLMTAVALLLLVVALVSSISAVRLGDLAREREAARVEAVGAKDKAETARDEARTAQRQEAEAREETRRQLYASDLNLAQQAWETGDANRVLYLLDRHRPERGQQDLRGFEWYYLWRLCHADQLTLRGHIAVVSGVAFSPDGNTLATASIDKSASAILWDAATGRERVRLDHGRGVLALAFSLDGTTLATATWDGVLTTWDTRDGKRQCTLKVDSVPRPRSWSGSVAFSPDGSLLAAAVGGQTVTVWNLATKRPQYILESHTGPIYAVTFAPDGKTIASASLPVAHGDLNSPSEVKLWDALTGEEQSALSGPRGGVCALAFDPAGRTLAVATYNNTIWLWDLGSQRVRAKLEGHKLWVHAIAFAPDGKTLATGSGDRSVKLWDVATGKVQATLAGHIAGVVGVAFSPDGKTLATAGADRAVKLWHLPAEPKWTALGGHEDEVRWISFSPDGQTLATSSLSDPVKLWDRSTGRELATLDGFCPAFSIDGTMVASVRGTSVEIWDRTTGQDQERRTAYTPGIYCLAFSPVSKLLAIGCSDGAVKFWDASTGEEWMTRGRHTREIATVGFSPDGKTVATGAWGDDHTVRLWDVATGLELATLEGHGAQVSSVAFAPDGKTLATASWDETVRLWDLSTHKTRLKLGGLTAAVCSVVFSPDGKRIATGGWDGLLRLWDVTSGQETLSVQVDPQRVWTVAFSPDGKTLAVGGRDHTVKLLETPTDEEVNMHPDVAILARARADSARDEEDYDRALTLYREALAVHRKILGEDDVWTGRIMLDVASLLARSSESASRAEAEQLLTAALEIFRRKLALPHPWHREAEQLCGELKHLDLVPPSGNLVPVGSVWKYLDDGSDQGTTWREPGFDDSAWQSGPGELGYGDGDEKTEVGFGPHPQKKHVTTYFRHAFEVTNVGNVKDLLLGLVRDDGAAVYLNGAEVVRDNLPPEATSGEFASATTDGSNEWRVFCFPVDPSLLLEGKNILAVEIHQDRPDSSDISFDLQLTSNATEALLKMLTGGSPGRRRDAAELLGELGAHARPAVPALVKALEDEDVLVRQRAAWALGRIGEMPDLAVPALCKALQDDNADLAAAAATALAAFPVPKEAAETIAQRLRRGLESDRKNLDALWDLWFTTSVGQQGCSAAEGLALWRAQGDKETTGRGADLHWVLSELATRGVVRINCGGEEYRSPSGAVWKGDVFFTSGRPGASASELSHLDVWWTENDPLYLTERWYPGDSAGPYGYRIPLPRGRYRVTLHFAEVFFTRPGQRQFDVILEGRKVLENYDPLRAGWAAAEQRTFVVAVTDGALNVETVHKSLQPKFSAIEVRFIDKNLEDVPTDYGPGSALADAKSYLAEKASEGLTPDDFVLALSTGRYLENSGSRELAAEAYGSFAEIFRAGKQEELSVEAEILRGARRRLESVGNRMELNGTVVGGGDFDWSAYRGKVVLVVFWAPSRDPATSELANVRDSYELYKDRGFEVVGVSLDDNPRELEQFLQRERLPWITLHDPEAGKRHPMAIKYGIADLPTMFLVDRDGRVVSTEVRGAELDRLLEELLGPS